MAGRYGYNCCSYDIFPQLTAVVIYGIANFFSNLLHIFEKNSTFLFPHVFYLKFKLTVYWLNYIFGLLTTFCGLKESFKIKWDFSASINFKILKFY